MRHKRLKLITTLFLCLGLMSTQAQEAIPASGGNASGSGGSTSYTVGQIVFNTITGTSGSVAQGVQQPYEISTTIGIPAAKGIELVCSAFPNPTQDYLTIKVENYDLKNLSYQLYDANGKLLGNEKLSSNQTKINMVGLAVAIYYVRILDKSNEVKTFKIIKN